MNERDFMEPDILRGEPSRFAWLIGAVALLLLVGALFFSLRSGLIQVGNVLLRTAPSREVESSWPSPDGEWVVELQYVNSGAAASAGYWAIAKSADGDNERFLASWLADDVLVGAKDSVVWRDEATVQVFDRVFDVKSGRELEARDR